LKAKDGHLNIRRRGGGERKKKGGGGKNKREEGDGEVYSVRRFTGESRILSKKKRKGLVKGDTAGLKSPK